MRLASRCVEQLARRATQRLHRALVSCSIPLDGALPRARRAAALRGGAGGLLGRSRPLRAAWLSCGAEAHAPILVPTRARFPPTPVCLGHWPSSPERITRPAAR